MNEVQFIKELSKIGLVLSRREEYVYSIRKKEFANPLLFFNSKNKGKNYNGGTPVKCINVNLYTPEQVYKALKLVNEYLSKE